MSTASLVTATPLSSYVASTPSTPTVPGVVPAQQSKLNAATRQATWHVPASAVSMRTVNPIRQIVDHMKVVPNKEKDVISLSIGDPTVYGNFELDEYAMEAVIKTIKAGRSNGYPPSVGYQHTRAAVAAKYTAPTAPLTASDVIIASGASGALDICISALCDPGTNILIPRPGFSLYETLARSKEIEVRYYNLLPEKNWEIDLDHLDSIIDDKTSCILVNNPSNPCGSVFTRTHLEQILTVCARHHLPIISDEIYGGLAFTGNTFTPIATLTDEVPVLTVGGIAKQYCVPGWRVGWILIHDRNDVLKQVRQGLIALTQLILGSNSLVQGALPEILHNTPQTFYDNTLAQLETNAKISQEMVSKIPGLKAIVPQGAMYMMVGINIDQFKDIKSDIEFTEKLTAEESVICLPGQCFKYSNFFRIVITPPPDRLEEAYKRMAEFCARHHI